MKKLNGKMFMRQLVIFFGGLNIIQFGVAIFLYLGIGSDPFTIFSQGIASLLNINIGNANRLLTFCLFLILFFIDRKRVNIGTILAVVFTGMFLNINIKLVKWIMPGDITLIGSIALFLLASIPVSIGFAILKAAKLGVAPNDSVYLAISDYTKKPYSIVRMTTDIVYIIVGMLFGGIAGIGTIICIIVLGPLTQLFMIRVECMLERFLNEKSSYLYVNSNKTIINDIIHRY